MDLRSFHRVSSHTYGEQARVGSCALLGGWNEGAGEEWKGGAERVGEGLSG
jgi:hypothetical protein